MQNTSMRQPVKSSTRTSKKNSYVEATSYIKKAIDALTASTDAEGDPVIAKEAIANLSVIYFDLQN